MLKCILPSPSSSWPATLIQTLSPSLQNPKMWQINLKPWSLQSQNLSEGPAVSSFRDTFFSRHVSANFWLMNAWSALFTALERRRGDGRGGGGTSRCLPLHPWLLHLLVLQGRCSDWGLACVWKLLSALQWVSENRLLEIRTRVERKQYDSMNVFNSHSLSVFALLSLACLYFLFHLFGMPRSVYAFADLCACVCAYVLMWKVISEKQAHGRSRHLRDSHYCLATGPLGP